MTLRGVIVQITTQQFHTITGSSEKSPSITNCLLSYLSSSLTKEGLKGACSSSRQSPATLSRHVTYSTKQFFLLFSRALSNNVATFAILPHTLTLLAPLVTSKATISSFRCPLRRPTLVCSIRQSPTLPKCRQARSSRAASLMWAQPSRSAAVTTTISLYRLRLTRKGPPACLNIPPAEFSDSVEAFKVALVLSSSRGYSGCWMGSKKSSSQGMTLLSPLGSSAWSLLLNDASVDRSSMFRGPQKTGGSALGRSSL